MQGNQPRRIVQAAAAVHSRTVYSTTASHFSCVTNRLHSVRHTPCSALSLPPDSLTSIATALLLTPSRYKSDGAATAEGVASHTHAPTSSADDSSPQPYNLQEHLQAAEQAFRERYGPHARIIFHRVQNGSVQNDQEEDGSTNQRIAGGGGGSSSTGAGDAANPALAPTIARHHGPNSFFRVSAVFRLLGYAVELAATKSRSAESGIENCLRQALSSDIQPLRVRRAAAATTAAAQARRHHPTVSDEAPEDAAVRETLNGLRDVCVFFSRQVKFSVKPPVGAIRATASAPAGGAAAGAPAPATAATTATTAETAPVAEAAHGGGHRESQQDDGTAGEHSLLWRCRAYVKDDWSITTQTRFAYEGRGNSPRQALAACAAGLRRNFQEELESPRVRLEAVRELGAILRGGTKECTAEGGTLAPVSTSVEIGNANGGEDGGSGRASDKKNNQQHKDSSPPSTTTTTTNSFTPVKASMTLQDGRGNTTKMYVWRRGFAAEAFNTLVWGSPLATPPPHPGAVVTRATGAAEGPPLLASLRWQLEHMTRLLTATHRQGNASSGGAAAEQVRVTVVPGGLSAASAADGADGGAADPQGVPLLFTASVTVGPLDEETSGGHTPVSAALPPPPRREEVIWQEVSPARYRVELEAYAQAVCYLLEEHREVWAGHLCASGYSNVTFLPTPAAVDAALAAHDSFDVLAAHKGKWNCYAVLGTLTSQLIGSFYHTHYHLWQPPPPAAAAADDPGTWKATLTVSNGVDDARVVLVQRSSRQKGEAWRNACLAAMQDNFPNQYRAAVAAHPDMDLSSDHMARSHRYRALPREKRIEHMGGLFPLVSAFAEEDLGWRHLRVRLRDASGQLGLPQWVAEMEAEISENDGGDDSNSAAGAASEKRRMVVVATSAAYSQSRQARRAVVYKVAQTHFPAELAVYQKLGRNDSADPDDDPSFRRLTVFQPGGPPFVAQLVQVLQRARPEVAPITWFLTQARDGSREHHIDGDEEEYESGDRDRREDWRAADIDGLSALEMTPAQWARALPDRYTAEVLGNNGDLLIASHTGGGGPIAVLSAALRAASDKLGGEAAATLWSEYAAHAIPPVNTSRELSSYLLSSFIGACDGSPTDAASARGGASAAATDYQEAAAGGEPARPVGGHLAGEGVDLSAALHARSISLGQYWVSLLTLPALGFLPVAKAVATSKRDSVADALLLAARQGFPELLRRLTVRDPAAGAAAAEVLTETVITELPAAARAQLRKMAAASKGDARTAEERRRRREAEMLERAPYRLLLQRVRALHGDSRCVRVVRSRSSSGANDGDSECRVYLQMVPADGTATLRPRVIVHTGDLQLIGTGVARDPAAALAAASREALRTISQ